jgi:hypothetical protein
MWEKEITASEMSAALGMEHLVPATVERSIGKFGKGALMETINHTMKNGTGFWDLSKYDPKDLSKLYDPIFDKLPPGALAQAAAFDYLLGNRDRHPNNWRTDGKNKIGLIDHGNTFPTTSNFILRSNFGAYAQRKKLKIGDAVSQWKGKWDVIEGIMNHRMAPKAIKLVKERYDELMANSTKSFDKLSIPMVDKVPAKVKAALAKKK